MSNRAKQIWIQYVFPAILLLYPLIKINQGIDLTDSMYGLVNFHFFPHGGGDWTVATYLANVLGAVLIRLPFGETLIGIRFYTGLIVSAMALFSYYFLKGKMPAWLAFAGELAAVSLCWIPTTSLYNYLTLALFLGGTVCLYRGLVWQRRYLMALAGVCLGANVLARVPNALECLLIAAVSVAAAMFHKLPIEGKKVVCIVSGGNIDVNILSRVITRGLVMGGRNSILQIALEDKPGQLLGVSEIISRCGGNVVSVHHERSDANMAISSCFLKIGMETRDFAQIQTIKDELTRAGFRIVSDRTQEG